MNNKVSLTEFQQVIRDSLYSALPGFYWVTAEIAELKENFNGHCYLELVEKQADEVNLSAKVRAVIWNNRYRFVRQLFEETTGEKLRAGIKVLLKIKVEYHEVYGLSLTVNDIDPAFTVGELALKRQQILKKLEEEGVIAMNRELAFPILPKRIAVISSKNAAGLTDFLKHLNENSFGYSFSTVLFEAAMQGTGTEESIRDSLDRIAGHLQLFDVVAIVRGGGSTTDLSWFDSYNIAYHITQFPLPVITGIGHEKDLSVTDLVANRSEKTPTALADFLVNRMAETEQHISELWDGIAELATGVIDVAAVGLENCSLRLTSASSLRLNKEKERLSGSVLRLTNSGKSFLIRQQILPSGQMARLASLATGFTARSAVRLGHFANSLQVATVSVMRQLNADMLSKENKLSLLSPENVLKRGYTITSVGGKIMLSASDLRNGSEIETQFSDGKVKSTVTEVKKQALNNK
jgi:exodeoxyribonuclease VII large subunit